MSDEKTLGDRIEALEARAMFQDDTIEALNKAITEQWLNLVVRELDRQHSAGGHPLHQLASDGYDRQGILQGKDARQTSGHVFADAVTEHRPGLRDTRTPFARHLNDMPDTPPVKHV